MSGDPLLADQLSSSLDVREIRVLPPGRALDAIGYDLVVLGHDALSTVRSNRSVVEALIRSGRLLLVAEPGADALGELLSALVEPVRVGEKPRRGPIVAFYPVYEEGGVVRPGAPGFNLVLVETWPLKGGRVGASYTASSYSDKRELGKAVRGLLRERYEGLRGGVARVNNPAAEKTLFSIAPRGQPMPLMQTEQYSHIGQWDSALYPITGSAGKVGETYVYIKVAYCTNCANSQYPNPKQWLVFLNGHYAKTWSGYSLPVKSLLGWVVEPSRAVLDAQTSIWRDQRVVGYSPTGYGQDGQISITISYPPGVTYTTGMLPQVTYEGDYTTAYSSYYGRSVLSAALWRWGLTSYDGSGAVEYSMGGYAEMGAIEPLLFAVRIKANAYLWSFFATSGEHNFYFAAYRDHLEYLGGG
ncbi:MAG: hypothetical protein ABWK01_00020 [Infirmifilum sp.]